MKEAKVKLDKKLLAGYWRWIKGAGHRLPRCLFIERSHEVDVASVILVLVVAAWLLIRVSFFDPPNVIIPEVEDKVLAVDLIDELEWWIEDVEAKRVRGLVIPRDNIFD